MSFIKLKMTYECLVQKDLDYQSPVVSRKGVGDEFYTMYPEHPALV